MKLKFILSILSPIKGLSDVIGMISETVLRNIVRESKIVTPTECLSNQNTKFKKYSRIRILIKEVLGFLF